MATQARFRRLTTCLRAAGLLIALLLLLPAAVYAQSLGMLLERGLVPGLPGRLLILEEGPITGGRGVDLAVLPAEAGRPGGLLLGSAWGDLLLYPEGLGGVYDPPQVWLGAEADQWRWPPVARQVSPELADWDGSGEVDLLVGWGEHLLLYPRREGRLEAGQPLPLASGEPVAEALRALSPTAGHLAPAVGDLDGDGRPDLLLGAEDGTVWWLRNTGEEGQMSLVAPRAVMSPTGPVRVPGRARPTLADVTGDGRADLLVGSAEGRLWLYPGMPTGLGPGRELAWAEPPEPPLSGSLTPRALPGSGELLLAQGSGSVRRVRYLPAGELSGLGRVRGRQTPLDVGAAPALCVADENGDGRPDLIAGDADGNVWVFRNRGGPREWRLDPPEPLRAQGQPVRAEGGWAWPLLADIDGDGDLDLLLGNGRGQVEVWLRTADLIRGAPLAGGAGPIQAAGPVTLALTDWEGDGKPDLLVGTLPAPSAGQDNVQIPPGEIGFFHNQAIGRVSLPVYTKGTLVDLYWQADRQGTLGHLPDLYLRALVPVPPRQPQRFLALGAQGTYLFDCTSVAPQFPLGVLAGPPGTLPPGLLPAVHSLWVTHDAAGRPDQVLAGITEYGMVAVLEAADLGLR